MVEDFRARVEGIDARLSRLESLLGGSVDILEGLDFPEGLRIPAGQGITFAPGSTPTVAEGQLYYDASADALKLRGASAWETVLSQIDAAIDSSGVSNLASTTTETQIKTVSVDFPRAGSLLVWFQCNPYIAAGKYTRFRLKIGGTTKRSNTYTADSAGSRGQVGFCWLETISSSGSQTVTVTAQNSDASYTTVFNDCTLVALALGL